MKKRKLRSMRFLPRMTSLLLVLALMIQATLGSGTITLASILQEELEVTEESQDTGAEAMTETVEEIEGSPEVILADPEPQILFEMEEMRGQKEKHYRLSDGTVMAAEYGMDVHYESEEGTWEDIDNRFRYEAASDTDSMEGYATAEGAVEFKFAPDADGEVVRATSGDHSVSFKLLVSETEGQNEAGEPAIVMAGSVETEASPITFIKGEILNAEDIPAEAEMLTTESFTGTDASAWSISGNISENSTENVQEDPVAVWAGEWEEASGTEDLTEQAALDQVVTSVGYEDVLPGTSLQYIAYGSSLKEYILVNERLDSYRYTFAMDLEDLVPEMQEDNSILLKDTEDGTVIYEIPAAYMTDAAGEYSDAVTMELTEAAEGIYELVINADAEWINDAAREFPVQIDPTLNNYLSTSGTNNIRGSYICKGKPDAKYINTGKMFVGYDSQSEKNYISYIQMKDLPELPKNSVICGAYFHMAQIEYSPYGMSSMTVLLKEITGTSWNDQFTWNRKVNDNIPATSSTVIDHQKLLESEKKYVRWNITDLVKDHYKDNKDGILGFALETYETMTNTNCAKATLRLTNIPNNRPVFQVFYRDTKGVESYYTYQTHGIGNAGTVYIGDYTSQMTLVRPAVSYSSTALSYDVGLVFNTAYADRYFSNDVSNGSGLLTKDFSGMYIGTGWKLTAQETIVETAITNLNETTTYLVYNDSDGTDHYFHLPEGAVNVYEDEDGLDLTITKDGTDYILSDEKDNKKTFTKGYLTKIEDENGNEIHIVYNGSTYSNNIINTSQGNRITSVVSKPKNGTAKTIFTMSYDSGGFLTEISDAYGNKCRLGHTSVQYSEKTIHLVSEIYHYDTSAGSYVLDTKYAYDSSHLGMTHAYDVETLNGVSYSYENSATGHRISQFYGYYASDIKGSPEIRETVSSSSDELRQTTYRSAGTDGVLNTSDDILTKYLFNSAGQTVNAMSEDTKGSLLGVTASTYTENSGTSKTNNRMTGSISSGQAGQNIFSNGGFELPKAPASGTPSTIASGWSWAGTGSAARRNESNGDSYSGQMHYNLYNSSASGTTWLYRTAELEPGETYTFSAYVNTLNGAEMAEDGGVYLKVARFDGYATIAESPVLSYATNADIDNGWQRISVTFVAPSDDGDITMSVYWEKAHGTLWVDDLQLEKESAASRFNC